MPNHNTISQLVADATADTTLPDRVEDLDVFSRRTVDRYAARHKLSPADALATLLVNGSTNLADWAEAKALAKAVRR
ncbi:hypothetical protein [Leifsonia sp. NPDC058248]|uniref:hypothetical protein n=1 Tax=Leifsonia sp. NPDC058248 TaxID=3346402 RepID=UPI0036D8E25E